MSMPIAAPEAEHCQVVALRQYTLHPQQRDVLIELFDREFVETQEAAGMRVIGQFRDLDNADRSVWLRGFADMASRPASLQAFYGGPVWETHREAANATMVDSDNVLLLRPVEPAANNFAWLPVREGEPVLVGLALFADAAALHAFAQGAWPREVLPALARWLNGPPQSMRLAPTARPALHA
jgi:hypothetical protein